MNSDDYDDDDDDDAKLPRKKFAYKLYATTLDIHTTAIEPPAAVTKPVNYNIKFSRSPCLKLNRNLIVSEIFGGSSYMFCTNSHQAP